jgi:hypothetical protein
MWPREKETIISSIDEVDGVLLQYSLGLEPARSKTL